MDLFLSILVFSVVVLAAGEIGKLGARFHLPLITGFLLAGILVGPDVLSVVTKETVENLDFVNQLALAIIAMAAGNELVLKEFRSQFRSIGWVTFGLVVITLGLGTTATFLLTEIIPFTENLPSQARLALSVMAGVILVARSPSSLIAIINELRAKGPFTQMVLGVTVIMDVAVIVLFAVGSEFAQALVNSNHPFNLNLIGLLLIEITLSVLAGYALWQFLSALISLSLPCPVKCVIILLTGIGVFIGSDFLGEYSNDHWSFELSLEPLLLCMIAGGLISNNSPHRVEFTRILDQISPPIFLAFFTLTGISIELDVLAQTWKLALILFVVRLIGIFLGTYLGGLIAGAPPLHRRIGWMSFVTQAGIGIGLAREIAAEFDGWGSQLATLLLAVIIFNQLLGPPLMKWSIIITKEGHARTNTRECNGVMEAIIFGSASDQSWMLAHRLESHEWNVTIATLDDHTPPKDLDSTITIARLADISEASFEALQLEHADALIAILSDEENLKICRLNYDHYGIERMIVKLSDHATELEAFEKLDALIVDPKTAMVSLLAHFTISPTGTAMLPGMKPDQDVLEIE